MDLKESNDLIVLTGAGFTKNFGGFLSSEMWSKIFNNPAVQKHNSLRTRLLEDFNFESVYSIIYEDTGISEIEKEDFQKAVATAYKSLDDAVRSWTFNDDNQTAFDIYKLFGKDGLINLVGPKKSFVFTLNQDLLLERRHSYVPLGVQKFPKEFYQFEGRTEFKDEYFVVLPKEDVSSNIEEGLMNHSGIHYIKLHGSYGWKSSTGSNQMVLGKNKMEQLKAEPLLDAYLNLFEQVVKQGDKKILIIGYGFQDDHINDILANAIEYHNLKLYIITTSSIHNFNSNLVDSYYPHHKITDGIYGFFPYKLAEILPPNQAGSVHLDEIKRALEN